ncbi:hypothetical protein CGRA01v4_15091 [Colletotrichum graminicola]|nr:hypothetical protein CGRA01v4_15091 [Colletotrichum graminicola]
MEHGEEFGRVVHARFCRLVRHYARRWVLANAVVVQDAPDQYRFNETLTQRWFGSAETIKTWLRQELGKLDPWEKEMLGM